MIDKYRNLNPSDGCSPGAFSIVRSDMDYVLRIWLPRRHARETKLSRFIVSLADTTYKVQDSTLRVRLYNSATSDQVREHRVNRALPRKQSLRLILHTCAHRKLTFCERRVTPRAFHGFTFEIAGDEIRIAKQKPRDDTD